MRNGLSRLLALCLSFWAAQAHGQLLSTYFPEGVPGYGDAAGVTVRSRMRPEYEPLGVRVGPWMVQPRLSFSIGYDDNVFAGPVRRGSWEFLTQPSLLVATEQSGGSLGLSASADDTRYLDEASQDRTDGSAFVGGTLNIGRDTLTLGGFYLARHEDRTELDAVPSDRPVAFQVSNLRAAYATTFGRLTVTPSLDINRWRFADTTILGVPVSEASRDRSTVQAQMTFRYAWMPARNLLIETRFLNAHYDHPVPGLPSNDSTSWQMLIGADYDDDTVWRYRVLGGAEFRRPASAAFATQTAGIAEAEVIWSPSGMTTIRAALDRGVADAAQMGLSSFTYTSATLTIDHELFRNLLLNASVTAREAEYEQSGGRQWGLAAGVSAIWLIDRNLRLTLSYGFSEVRNSDLPAGAVAGNYIRDLGLLTLRVGL
jgi:hypothetical protein